MPVPDAAALRGGVAGHGAAADRRRGVVAVADAAAIETAELPVRVLPLTVSVPWLKMPPPLFEAELPVRVLPLTLTVPVPKLPIPPPLDLAMLLDRVLPLTVSVPSFWMPPPRRGGVAGQGAAADRQRAVVVDAAADLGGVAGQVLPLTVSVPLL